VIFHSTAAIFQVAALFSNGSSIFDYVAAIIPLGCRKLPSRQAASFFSAKPVREPHVNVRNVDRPTPGISGLVADTGMLTHGGRRRDSMRDGAARLEKVEMRVWHSENPRQSSTERTLGSAPKS
jgi:hypothetical protein